MKINKIITIGLSVFLFCTPFTTVNANSLSPAINQYLLSTGDTTSSKILFTNTTNKEIYIQPTVVGFNPKSNDVPTNESYMFIKTDKDVFKIEPNSTFTLNYQVIVAENLSLGTYYNLIILKQTNDSGFINTGNTVGAIENLSHLVVLHVIDKGDVKGITSNFAQISMEIIDKGIPFIKNTKVKYIYQNITNYVLIPDGEIQVYNNKGKYSPLYYKINQNKQKLYPKDIIEETITIDQWKIYDLIYPRTILGLFYNGIDENSELKEIHQNSSYFFVISGVTILTLGFILFNSIRNDRRRSKA